MPGTLPLERQVTVELKRYPSSPAEEDRLEFRWFPVEETVPCFNRTFAVRSQGADTQLVLSGRYQPPFERLILKSAPYSTTKRRKVLVASYSRSSKRFLRRKRTQLASSTAKSSREAAPRLKSDGEPPVDGSDERLPRD